MATTMVMHLHCISRCIYDAFAVFSCNSRVASALFCHFSFVSDNCSQILKKMCPVRTQKFERISRISTGYVQNVAYIASIII